MRFGPIDTRVVAIIVCQEPTRLVHVLAVAEARTATVECRRFIGILRSLANVRDVSIKIRDGGRRVVINAEYRLVAERADKGGTFPPRADPADWTARRTCPRFTASSSNTPGVIMPDIERRLL
jgi:hypothetical protein